MSDLSIDQIKLKANQARDLFKGYIDNLVTAGETRTASDREIEFFNLTPKYLDNKISANEANDIKALLNSIDIDQLVNNKDITYNKADQKLSIARGAIDINNDGITDLKDLSAINYLINFRGDNVNLLENILDISGNEDKKTEFNIKQWANARGLVSGSEAYNKFYNKFYNDLYKNATPKANIEVLQKTLRLYDIGLGKKDINDIDSYMPLIKTDTLIGVIVSLYQFENSAFFNVPAEEKKPKLNTYINMLKSSNEELKRVLTEALTRRRVPITGKELNVTNLDYVLELQQIPKKEDRDRAINTVVFNQWADKRNLTGTKRNEFIAKMENFTSQQGRALSIGQLKTITDIYDLNNREPNNSFDINILDIYADGIKQNISPKTLSLIYKFEKSEGFGLTEPARSLKLQEYFRIASNESSQISSYFLQALQTQKIPFSAEPINVRNLDKFIEKITARDGIIDQVINNWAKERNLVGENHTAFFNKLKEYHAKGINQNQMKTLLGFYDEAKKNNRNFPLSNLDAYVKGIQKEVKMKHLANLFKFETNKELYLSGTDRNLEMEKLIDVLAGGEKKQKDIRKQEVLERTLSLGKTVFMSNEEISLENIKKVFNKIDDENNKGYEKLQIENLARERKLTSPEKEVFISKLEEWYLPQTDPTKNLQLKINDINNLANLYDGKKLNLNDLEVYAKAISEGVPFKTLNVIYKFETTHDIKNNNSNRNLRINNYISILKAGNQDKTRVMLNTMKTGRLPITDKLLKEPNESSISEAKLNEFSELLKKYDSEENLTIANIESWSNNPNFPQGFKAKFLNYYRNNDFKLNQGQLITLKRLYENNPSIELDKLDVYAKAIKANTSFKDLSMIFKLNSDSRFNAGQEKIAEFLEIMTTGTNNEKYVLVQALKNNNIPYINKKFLEANSARLTELNDILRLVKNETELNRFRISNWAKEMKLEEGSNDYNKFMQKFFDGYLNTQKIPLSQLDVLQGIFKFRKHSYERMDIMVNALKSGVSILDLKKLDDISSRMNFSETQFIKYLNILMGQEGESRQKVIIEMIRTNSIPMSNIRI